MSAATSLQAKDVMTTALVNIDPATTIRQLARIFELNQISGAPVVDGKGKLVGVVSKSDLIMRFSEGTDDHPPGYLFELICKTSGADPEMIPEPLLCVDDFMTRNPITARPETPISEIAPKMVERRIHRVIVVDEANVPVGVITSLDLLKAMR